MQLHEFNVEIEAPTYKRAKEVLEALFDIKTAVTDDDLIKFAKAIKKKPSLINRAKMFI